MQRQIDAGVKWCHRCARFGRNDFCGQCGRRYHGDEHRWRECPNEKCRAQVTTNYCPLCGHLVADDFLQKMERGEVDWHAESRQAGEIVKRILKNRPDLAPELVDEPPPLPSRRDPTALVGALNVGFGHRR